MKFSFIVVNYNCFEDLKLITEDLLNNCITSEDELLVIDNHSPNQNLWFNFCNEYASKVQCLNSNENLGFGKAVNLAAKQSTGDFLVLVNPDCRIESRQFRMWVRTTNEEFTFDILAPRICYPDLKPQANLGFFASPLTFIMQFLRVGALLRKLNLVELLIKVLSKIQYLLPSYIKNYLQNFNKLQYQVITADWVSGAFMVIKRSSFFEINGFDDAFFMYCEDEDLCRRLHLKNKLILWSPTFTVIHTEAGTDNDKKLASKLSRAQKERFYSRLYYIKKWFGPFYLMVFRLFYFFGFLILSLFHLLFARLQFAISEFKFSFQILIKKVGP